jgi:hypothetical protein
MNTLEASPNAHPKRRGGVLLCRWEQLDEGTLTAVWRAASLSSVTDPPPLDPTVPGSPEHSGAEKHSPDCDFHRFSLGRDIEAPGVRPDRSTKWSSRVADIARVALVSAAMMAVCTCGVQMVQQALTGSSEAVDVVSGR